MFAADVTYDVRALGGGVLTGLAAVREAALALGEANPVAHHVTNIVVTEAPDGTVRALSKGSASWPTDPAAASPTKTPSSAAPPTGGSRTGSSRPAALRCGPDRHQARAEPAPGPGQQLVHYAQPPAGAYAGASGHQKIFTCPHKPG